MSKNLIHAAVELTTEEFDAISQDALNSYPNEVVWLKTDKGTYKVDNVSQDPAKSFAISPADTGKAYIDKLIAVIHSHCDSYPVPSKADMENQLLTGVPWGILSTNGKVASKMHWFGFDEILPLLGRGFMHATSDCYTLVRDFQMMRGIRLPEFPRDWEWWEKGGNLITEGLEESKDIVTKLVDASSMQEGDILFFQHTAKTPVHCSVYVGENLMLHHPGSYQAVDLRKLSTLVPVTPWLRMAPQIYRPTAEPQTDFTFLADRDKPTSLFATRHSFIGDL